VVAGRFLGGDAELCEASARAVVRSYRKRMRRYAEAGHLAVGYSRIVEQRPLIVRETRTIDGRPVAEAVARVLAPYAGASPFESEGQRVVVGQRLIQGSPDIFLGWGQSGSIHFYIRQLRDMKGGVDMEPGKVKVRNIPEYAKLCGWALALAHAKSGDPALIAGYAGKSEALDEAVARYAAAYADRTERDHALLVKAAREKRIPVAKVS
jgi:hypothetical protein